MNRDREEKKILVFISLTKRVERERERVRNGASMHDQLARAGVVGWAIIY
jgi:hypothetical protein